MSCRTLFKVGAEQALINVAELADFERGVINCISAGNQLLTREDPGRRLGEDKLLEDTRQCGIAHPPLLQERMQRRVEQTAVVTRNLRGLIFGRVVAVDEVEQLQQFLVKFGERV